MSDSKNCPLCGREIDDEYEFCSSCREIADLRSTPLEKDQNRELIFVEKEDVLTDKVEEEIIETKPVFDEPKQKKRKWLSFVLIGVFVLLLVSGAGAYYFRTQQLAKEAEQNVWDKCIELNTPQEYSNYLKLYPEGQFRVEAEKRINDLRKQEYNEWIETKNSYDLLKLTGFLAAYPETPHKAEILQIADSLSWDQAQKMNTADAYDAYLRNAELGNISGDYESLAREKFAYLSTLVTVEGEDLIAVQKHLSDFFSVMSTSNLKGLDDMFAPVVRNFYDEQNVPNREIREDIIRSIKKNKIQQLKYDPNFTTLSVVQDSTKVFFAELSLTKTAKVGKDEPTLEKQNVTIELLPNYKIVSLRKKKDSQ